MHACAERMIVSLPETVQYKGYDHRSNNQHICNLKRGEGTPTFLFLQAEDGLEAQEWMEAIQGVTACLLNGDVDVEALSRAQPKPSRPTHSRQGSRAGTPYPHRVPATFKHCLDCCLCTH